MLKEVNKTINGREFWAMQWPATKAYTLKFKLVKHLGPAFKKITESKAEEGADAPTFISAISEVFLTSEPEEITQLIKEMLEGCGVDGNKITQQNFDTVFYPDDMFTVYAMVGELINLNFLKGQGSAILEKVTAQLKNHAQ